MAIYELEWTMQGRASIEADDPDEAEQILHDGLQNMDTSMFETVDVNETTTESVTGPDED